MAQVFILAEPRPNRTTGQMANLVPLEDFGEIRVILPVGLVPEYATEESLNTIEDTLQEFDPKTDFITTVGGSYMAAVALGMILRDMGHEQVTFLRFDRQKLATGGRSLTNGTYKPVTVDLTRAAYDFLHVDEAS